MTSGSLGYRGTEAAFSTKVVLQRPVSTSKPTLCLLQTGGPLTWGSAQGSVFQVLDGGVIVGISVQGWETSWRAESRSDHAPSPGEPSRCACTMQAQERNTSLSLRVVSPFLAQMSEAEGPTDRSVSGFKAGVFAVLRPGPPRLGLRPRGTPRAWGPRKPRGVARSMAKLGRVQGGC